MKPKVGLCIFHETTSRNVLASDIIYAFDIDYCHSSVIFFFGQLLETKMSDNGLRESAYNLVILNSD